MGIQNLTDIKLRYMELFAEDFAQPGRDRSEWALFDISADTAIEWVSDIYDRERYGFINSDCLRDDQWLLVDPVIARGAGYGYQTCMTDIPYDRDHDDCIAYFYYNPTDDDPTEGVVICKGDIHILIHDRMTYRETERRISVL